MGSIEADIEFFKEVEYSAGILNCVSLSLSVVLAFIIGTSIVLKFRASERLSFRLYLFLALADILTHAPLLKNYRTDPINCQVVNNLIFFANIFSVLVTTVMAFNLHLVFLLNRPSLVRSGKFYICLCLLLSILISAPFFILGFMKPVSCPFYLRFDPPFDVLAMYGLFGIWILVPTLYCFYVFISIIIKITIKPNTSVNSSEGTLASKSNKLQMKRMVARLVLYPLVPVITILPYLISMTVSDKNTKITRAVFLTQYLCATIQGSLNFLFFLFDPALPIFWVDAKDKIIDLFDSLRCKPTKLTKHSKQLSDCTNRQQSSSPIKDILDDLNREASIESESGTTRVEEDMRYRSDSIEMSFPITDSRNQFTPNVLNSTLLI